VIIDEIWIDDRIYRTLTESNYDSLNVLHIPKITVTTAHEVLSVVTGRYLAAAPNIGHLTFPYLWISEQLAASHFSQLQLLTQSHCRVMTYGQSVSLANVKRRFITATVASLLSWSAATDERTGM
jgi:hypothetical protein